MAALYLHTRQWSAIALLACFILILPRPIADAIGRLTSSSSAMSGSFGAAPLASKAIPADLPTPEPLVFAPVGRDRARLLNAQIPMAASVGVAAQPFYLTGDLPSRVRAIDCLASAMWYEAGNDLRGQRAVGQVVLNRLRHPSFPASVCGVVFQGSERKTGCQFTFTCDGALARRPSLRDFSAAQVEARALLTGVVGREVGLATHYHTDWVHPIWSASLAKIARVGTHLFFRWTGRGGDARMMVQRYAGSEPTVAALAGVSALNAETSDEVLAAGLGAAGPLALPLPISADASPAPATVANVFEMPVQSGGNGAVQAMVALELCGERAFCKVIGRPPEGAAGSVAFLFVRDRRTGVERVLWDCEVFRRTNPAQCLSVANRSWIGFTGNLQTVDPRVQG